MKIQLDLQKKTIKFLENVSLEEMFKILDEILPNNKWKEFTLECNTTVIYWNDPIIINPTPVIPFPDYPTYPWITYDSGAINVKTMYNIEIK